MWTETWHYKGRFWFAQTHHRNNPLQLLSKTKCDSANSSEYTHKQTMRIIEAATENTQDNNERRSPDRNGIKSTYTENWILLCFIINAFGDWMLSFIFNFVWTLVAHRGFINCSSKHCDAFCVKLDDCCSVVSTRLVWPTHVLNIKKIVHSEFSFLSSFTHPRVVSNPYDFLSFTEYKRVLFMVLLYPFWRLKASLSVLCNCMEKCNELHSPKCHLLCCIEARKSYEFGG